jgi:hypothetical protein
MQRCPERRSGHTARRVHPETACATSHPARAPLADLAAHVEAHHAAMALWDAVLPGRVLHLLYSELVTDVVG